MEQTGNDPAEEFRRAIQQSLGVDPGAVVMDGKIHRFSTKPGQHDKNGWYVGHSDGLPAGAFGDWGKGDESENWCAKSDNILTPVERQERRQRLEEIARTRDAERQHFQAGVAARASVSWENAQPPDPRHRYLVEKRVGPHGLRQSGGRLVLPIFRDGEIVSLQFIYADGTKLFFSGSAVGGGSFPIGELREIIVICEGFATGASIHEATGYGVVCALNAGNLARVARTLRAEFPAAKIVIAADDDYMTDGNPGVTKARAAAREIGAFVALPPFDRATGADGKDWNDLSCAIGPDSVKLAFEKSVEVASPSLAVAAPLPFASADGAISHVALICGSSIKPQPIAWIWSGWLARGKAHILGGQPGTGKTTLAMWLAAIITTGGEFPDGSRCEPGNVVIWSGEDDPADTLMPRLIAAGADISRVYFVGDVREGDKKRSFDPAKDTGPLREAVLKAGGAALIIVDPIVSAVAGDSHKNADVRRALQPLVDLASGMNAALLGITHFSKGTTGRDPVERLTGSLAFGALARVVMVAAKKQAKTEGEQPERIFCRAKSNIGPDDGGFIYEIQQGELHDHPGVFASSVVWGERLDGSARELLADAEDADQDGGARSEAEDFLADFLADGPRPAKEVQIAATTHGLAWISIKRAKKNIGVETRRTGFGQGGGWEWHLPHRGSKGINKSEPKNMIPYDPLCAEEVDEEVEVEI